MNYYYEFSGLQEAKARKFNLKIKIVVSDEK